MEHKSGVDFAVSLLINFIVLFMPLFLVHQVSKFFLPDSAKDPKDNPYTMQILSNSLEMAAGSYLWIVLWTGIINLFLNIASKVSNNIATKHQVSQLPEIEQQKLARLNDRIKEVSDIKQKKFSSPIHTPQNLEPVLQDAVLAAALTAFCPQYTATTFGLAFSQATVKAIRNNSRLTFQQ